MKILYISHLSTNIAAGMNWSVPASIKAQEKIDDVLWINTTDVIMPHWKETKAYRNLKDLGGKLSLHAFPDPFDKPDVVVFEGIYFKEYIGFSKELQKKHIPYVIIPRGSMTYQAMHNHAWLKKWIAHKIWFDGFINNAWRIQYLTQQEADDSTKLFKTPLLDAITEVYTELHDAGFFLNIYGPHRYDYEKLKNEVEKRGINDITSVNDEISGKEKEQVILDSDLFIMTSRFEGHPMGLIEALAYGLPCLVTPGTNMLEEIKKADAGWVSEGNVESIKKALLNIIADKGSFGIKSQHAKQLASHYNWDKLAVEFHKQLMILSKY